MEEEYLKDIKIIEKTEEEKENELILSIIKTKKVYSKKTVIPMVTDELLKKVAK